MLIVRTGSHLYTLSYYTSRCTYKVCIDFFFPTYALYLQSILEGMFPLPKPMSRFEKNIANLKEIGFDDV